MTKMAERFPIRFPRLFRGGVQPPSPAATAKAAVAAGSRPYTSHPKCPGLPNPETVIMFVSHIMQVKIGAWGKS